MKKDKFNIKLIKILTDISSSLINISTTNQNDLQLTEGNCVLNYFYHSFIKYPFLGALQYNYYKEKQIKNIYIFEKNLGKKEIEKYEKYFNELKAIFAKKKQINFDDLNYEFKGSYKKSEITKETNLDDLIIKFIEVIPLQIAKIKNFYFKAMSNGKEINKNELFETVLRNQENKDNNDENDQVIITKQELSEFIDFGMINSILNFYDLPVIVSSFMGSQSIGKSTLSNELFESFFNVSGMRCTEGIWMAISLFKGKGTQKKCENNCNCCEVKRCVLYNHDINSIKCICEECRCNKKCCLFPRKTDMKPYINCCVNCALPSGHNNKCKVHSKEKCEKHIKDKTSCSCNENKITKEIHICERPYNHGFICISLDFEGLGTFERSLEQDIDLAMVGAAVSNSLILRAGNTFDKFMQSRMLDWSEGSKNIKDYHHHYFGGNIIFCQKDVTENSNEEIQNEFNQRISESIVEWSKKNQNNSKKNINQIFGIFSEFYNSPTPIFNTEEFYSTLRDVLIHTIIKNVLINKSNPCYPTGKEFMLYLKGILATVDIHDYNALDNIAIDNLKKYLDSNKIKALEIFGIYPRHLEKKDFNDVGQLEEYLRKI